MSLNILPAGKLVGGRLPAVSAVQEAIAKCSAAQFVPAKAVGFALEVQPIFQIEP